MPTLSEKLQTTSHVSPLKRKARRLGIATLEEAMALAVERGCSHYRSVPQVPPPPVSPAALADEELVILLLLGEQPYEPFAVRIAAQLAGSDRIDFERLALLARQERCERVLGRIARAGRDHDPAHRDRWETLLAGFGAAVRSDDPVLPHWSRFVSDPGRTRDGISPPVWLTPRKG